MAKQYRNHNIRFNMTDEGGGQAWERLHSEEVEQSFKSQNAFVVAAINDYYERHLAKKKDPYLESREKEDAFADRLVQSVEVKLVTEPIQGIEQPIEVVKQELSEPEENEFLDYSFGV